MHIIYYGNFLSFLQLPVIKNAHNIVRPIKCIYFADGTPT
jgi:hypothetical protein